MAQIVEDENETSQEQNKPDPPSSYTIKETDYKKKKLTKFGKKLTGDE